MLPGIHFTMLSLISTFLQTSFTLFYQAFLEYEQVVDNVNVDMVIVIGTMA